MTRRAQQTPPPQKQASDSSTSSFFNTNQSKNVDTTKTTTHVSLCAGYGGIDLGLSRAITNLRTIAFSEIEAFACANLVAKMEAGLLDAAPIWTNLKTFPWSEFRDRVDILSGGYPCQPFSAAGKRLGTEDPRHLWPFIAAGIVSMRPRICFFENVEGHISLGLREVVSELEGLGYQTTWGVFSAREVGAPHQRKRVFILAYCHGERGQLPDWWRVAAEQVPVGYGEAWRDGLANAGGNEQLPRPRRDLEHNAIQPAQCNDGNRHSAAAVADPQARQQDADNQRAHGQACCQAWPSRPGQPQHGWEPPRVVGNARGQESCRISSGCGWEEVAEAWQSGDTMGDSESIRSSTRRTEHEGLGGELCTTSTGGEGAMGNSEGWSNGQQPTEQQGRDTSWRSGEESGAMGNASMLNGTGQAGGQWETQTGRTDTARNDREAQPSLGGNSDGSANRMDDAELFVTSDNRTDELRLLGNGVVPATATRAFRVLMDQLLNETNHDP